MDRKQLTQAEFDALPEYSLIEMEAGSTVYVGKRWKRRGATAWYMAEIVDGGGFPEMLIYEIEITDEAEADDGTTLH